jgi:tetratricopeptide (TPR) repeat protein
VLARAAEAIAKDFADRPATLSAIANMGYLLEAMGRLDEALPYYEEAMEGFRRVLGNNHVATLTLIRNTSSVLRELGNPERAAATLEEAHAILYAPENEQGRGREAVLTAWVDLQDAWNTAEPGAGHGAKAAEWRAKLEELKAGATADGS